MLHRLNARCTVALKGQHHAIFSNTSKSKIRFSVDAKGKIMVKIPFKVYCNAKKLYSYDFGGR